MSMKSCTFHLAKILAVQAMESNMLFNNFLILKILKAQVIMKGKNVTVMMMMIMNIFLKVGS